MLLRINQFNQSNIIVLTIIPIILLAAYASVNYSGNISVYLLFTLLANLLLYLGFSKNAIFFDAFIGVFFWVGFWLKLTLRVAFFDGSFNEAVGNFDKSGLAFDRSLLVASCGLSGLLLSSLIRRKLFFNYYNKIHNFPNKNLFNFYRRYKSATIFLFILLFLFIAISNWLLGIYQKGGITQKELSLGLNYFYKWMLMFGLASISALILNFELKIQKKISFLVLFLTMLESFFSNVSMFSRGMILNFSALFYGLIISTKINAIKLRPRFLLISFLIFATLFVSSLWLSQQMRLNCYSDSGCTHSSDVLYSELNIQEFNSRAAPLFIDRWVGMEGVMAVSSYPNLSWDLWRNALKESYNEEELSFFDKNFIQSPYVNADKTKHHFISLPGIVAFFFYPGSFWFLFVSMFALGGFAAFIEFSVRKLGGENLILCALLAQVVAYRFACFGYVPGQSYLLLGALFLNLFIIYFAEKLIGLCKNTVG